jgi:hypothetical protein
LVIAGKRIFIWIELQNISFFIFFLSLSLAKLPPPSLYSPSPLSLFSSSPTFQNLPLSKIKLMYGTSKIKEQIEALFELVLPLYPHKGKKL